MIKKLLFVTGLLFSTALMACSNREEPDVTEQEEPAITEEFRSVIDHNGNEIELPYEINRIAIVSPWPLASVYALFAGSGEGIVAVHPSIQSAAQHSFLDLVAPEITVANTGWVQGTDINIEELMLLEPDVVFISANNEIHYELLKNAGIPAVAFSPTIANWNTIETVSAWLELLGDVFDEPIKADELTTYAREVEAMILETTSQVQEKYRPTALILMRYDENQMQVVGPSHFGQYWLNAAGAVNVAEELTEGLAVVSMEQVLEWNPDILFITNFSPVLAEDFEDGLVFEDDWSTVEAVINGRVYKFPMGMYRWYPATSDASLTLRWMAGIVHPDLFSDMDLQEEIANFYERFYGITLTDEDIHRMMNPPREAAAGS